MTSPCLLPSRGSPGSRTGRGSPGSSRVVPVPGRGAGHRREYIAWITDAKKEETRQRRIREAVDRLERNERLGMK